MEEKNKLYYYPMKMNPLCKDYLWGGEKLKQFNKRCECEKIAESWEVSCNDAGLTTIANGIYAGKLLKNVLESSWKSFLGEKCSKREKFPLLIKFIDAQNDLSIQVHPSELTANKTLGELSKSELWYIIDTEPDSYIYLGFKRDISTEEFMQHLKDHTICKLLNKINVKKGETYYIPAGTIHALGRGILAAEIQQNSNTTFRIYDYDRKDANGKLRELHIDSARNTLNFKKFVPDLQLKKNFSEFKCEYFKVKKEIIISEKIFKNIEKSFDIVQFISGRGKILCENLEYQCRLGDTFFIPAKIEKYTIVGSCEVLITQN